MKNDNMISPNPAPRTIGVVWLAYFAIAILGGLLSRGIVIPGDPATTAANLAASAGLYRAGISLDFVGNIVYIALLALLYGLFRPVNWSLALMALLFGLVGATVQITAELLRLFPQVVLADTQLAGAFSAQQLQAAAVFGFKLYARSFEFSFVLFACFELLTGYLILKSTFLPRAIGVLWLVAGLSWPIFLWPPLAMRLQPLIVAVGGVAEITIALWLLIKGVDAEKWAQWNETSDRGLSPTASTIAD